MTTGNDAQQPTDDLDMQLAQDKARDVASSIRSLIDPETGRIDNWSDR